MSLLDKFKKKKKTDTIESSIDNDFVDNKVVLTAEQKKKADPKYRILEIYEEEKEKAEEFKRIHAQTVIPFQDILVISLS